jgi:hypothetical protein
VWLEDAVFVLVDEGAVSYAGVDVSKRDRAVRRIFFPEVVGNQDIGLRFHSHHGAAIVLWQG